MKKSILKLVLLGLLIIPGLADTPELELEISSDPPGCSVFIDRVFRGHTPLKLTDVAAGSYLLRVAGGEAFHPHTEEIKVEAGIPLHCQVRLEPLSSTTLEEGVRSFRAGDGIAAAEQLKRAADGEPPQPKAHWWLGRLAYEQKDFSAALSHFLQYAQVFPNEPRVHLYLADLHYKAERLGPAVTSYKLALLAAPDLKTALNDTPAPTWEAIKAVGEPDDAKGQLVLAYLYEQKGLFSEALNWLQKAVQTVYPAWRNDDLSS